MSNIFASVPARILLPISIASPNFCCWEHAVRKLTQAAPASTRSLEAELSPSTLDELAPVVRTIVEPMAMCGNREQVVRAALLASAASGHLRVYVRAHDGETYELQSAVWRGSHYLAANPLALAATGSFAIAPNCLGHGSPEVQCGGALLLLEQHALDKLTGRGRSASLRQIGEEARAVVGQFLMLDGRRPMKKAAFIASMKERLPTASTRQILVVWRSSLVPRHWRKPGRRISQ